MTSKKLTLVVFKSLSQKTLQMPFLIFSISRGVPLKAAQPSSRYKPIFWLYFLVRSDKRKHPTSSQVSAPSKDPIVTSNRLLADFFSHGQLSLNSRDHFACKIISRS